MTFKTPTPTVRTVDHLHPEDEAMLQALYSRSAASVSEHLQKLAKTGSGKFMEQFYVGYGHASIGDCGTTTLFFENVSTLAAKAIQDWPLYCGQETSTRYIDMSQQPIVDPAGTADSRMILERWMAFYVGSQAEVADWVRVQNPRRESEDEGKYEGAVRARTFDILRGFLPAGICTQLSWHTNLRQAKEHLAFLHHHPCEEISVLAASASTQLHERYGSSGFGVSEPKTVGEMDRLAWLRGVGLGAYTEAPFRAQPHFEFKPGPSFSASTATQLLSLLQRRPRGMALPRRADAFGSFSLSFSLDFGSFRDIQRHRAGITFMPLLTTKGGFESWYVEQLPPVLRLSAKKHIAEQEAAIRALAVSPEERQYYCALGHRVPCEIVYGLGAAIYVAELRSTKFIHPTLRSVVRDFGICVEDVTRTYDMAFYPDRSEDDWDVRRGGQTITEKVL